MIKVLITGADGQLGQAIRQCSLAHENLQLILTNKYSLDIANQQQVDLLISQHCPDYIINCSAYTAVDLAEDNQVVAQQVNSLGPDYLSKTALKYHAKLIHISTDFVFDGNTTCAYKETAATAPVNYYGQTKLQGENNIIRNMKDYIIIRTSWLYSYNSHNFFNTMNKLLTERSSLKVVNDQFGSPTYCSSLAEFILLIVSRDWQEQTNHYFNNIFHYSNSGICSWFDFACEINHRLNTKCTVQPITTLQYPTAALRPKFSALDTTKAATMFNITIPSWQEGLAKCILEKEQHYSTIN